MGLWSKGTKKDVSSNFGMDKRYAELLQKYAQVEDLHELINLVIIDNKRVRELCYMKTGSYPQERDLLEKLRVDLLTLREV